MDRKIKIGTRTSELALWQATQVEQSLQKNGLETELVPMKNEGDIDLKTPLYKMGIQGVFTRYLDAALLAGKVDIVVHSMKDVPTILAEGISQAAVLQRGTPRDLLVYKKTAHFLDDFSSPCVIATGSVRRRAQWLHRYPKSTICGLRGSVNTRLRKVQENDWDGALFAQAGLERINIRPKNSLVLDWMLPAPAQGAILVVCRTKDADLRNICAAINDENSARCVKIERDFLKTLMGGCSTPISALAEIKEEKVLFEGNILTPDGAEKVAISKKVLLSDSNNLGILAAQELLDKGGQQIVEKMNI